MDWKIVGEVVRISFWGVAISAPLKYYLLKHHVDRPTQNAAVMVVWGLVTGHFLFAGCHERLNTPPPEHVPYMLGRHPMA